MNPNAKEVPFQEQYTLFVGFDWASDHHDAVAVDASGQVVLELTLEDTAEGWASLRQNLIERKPSCGFVSGEKRLLCVYLSAPRSSVRIITGFLPSVFIVCAYA